MRNARQLTTTSFAILGLLALRPWATYELAKQVNRSLSHFWPRAESNLYAEPKRLVNGGYATARREQAGGRRRTVYAITPLGRKALRRWLAEAGGEVRLESAPLLKVFFADQGTKEDLLATIRAIGEVARQHQARLRRIAREYGDGGGPFPERLALALLAVRLVWDELSATIAWSRDAAAIVERWRNPGPGEVPAWPPGLVPQPPAPSKARRSKHPGNGKTKRPPADAPRR